MGLEVKRLRKMGGGAVAPAEAQIRAVFNNGETRTNYSDALMSVHHGIECMAESSCMAGIQEQTPLVIPKHLRRLHGSQKKMQRR